MKNLATGLIFVLFTLAQLSSSAVWAETSVKGPKKEYPTRCVVVTGVASMDGVSKEFARQMAIRNGLKQASMQSNLKISSDQVVKDFMLSKDATRFTSNSKVSQFLIVEEGVQEADFNDRFDDKGIEILDEQKLKKMETYQVKMEVCLTEDPQACNNVPGNHYQPKLAIARPITTDSRGATDISNLLGGFQTELQRRLYEDGYRNMVMIEDSSLLDTTQAVAPNLSPDVLEPIREGTGAQYLLLTVIRSVSRHNDDPKLWNDFKRFYSREVHPNSRFIETDTYIVDLYNYDIVLEKRNGFDIKGDVTVGRERPFGTNAFFATNTGMVFHALLNNSTQQVYGYMRCKPVETRIIDIRGNDYVIYLSNESGAQVGDELAVYHNVGRPVRYQGNDLGLDSEPTGFLKIKRIQSRFAVGEVLAKDGLIQIGDKVRSW